ncbi:MAG: transcription termination/antitermination protein NusG [Campylobacteraceae bacterium]|jgi:transcriptional antiterminator NusG|nr:transcription termination/antitermination protein NusG [Campylobacteraceae bacterium]MBT3882665.1 transcription termination/antitermination protein NusG [Campylobacteraceae bacterium]MBT4179605.1 transcription termination/antitermination protein NusG [Campylobacteraceae bacterium]MBT4707522.1 transcription termination/antitermination protein NusG [Campylobacteraceae bacterium]MBT7118242.1 transcription termination/antitermination protein NusG [Campylobacteraceae bacterium]
MAHQWYAIQTHSGSEVSVKNALLRLKEEMQDGRISEVLVPTEDLIEIKKGNKVIVERPLYPAYAFAKIDLDTALWHAIQSMPKVGRFIGESKRPTALSEKDINSILEKVEKKAAPRPKVAFDQGETVRIKDGSFANFNGIVENFDMTSGMLTLNVSIFGRNTPVEISYTQVELVV